MSIVSCIVINGEFWSKLEELRTALDDFSPKKMDESELLLVTYSLSPRKLKTKRKIEEDNIAEESRDDTIDFLKRSINFIGDAKDTFKDDETLRRALKRVSDATDETQWLLKELNTRTDESAETLRNILQQMKNMVSNKDDKYYHFEHMSGPVFHSDDEGVNFLLSRLRDLYDQL